MLLHLEQIKGHQSQESTASHPLNLLIEISARCPQRCPMCPLQGSDMRLARTEGLMDVILFERVIDELAVNPPDVVCLHSSGESTVHPKFAEMGSYARRKLPKTHLRMNTGGITWSNDERRTKWLKIGLDKLTFSIEACRWLQDGLDADGKPYDPKTHRADVKDEYKRYTIHPYRAGAPWGIVVPNIIATARILRRLKAKAKPSDPVNRVNLGIQHMVTREQEVMEIDAPAPNTSPISTWEIEFSRAFWRRYGVEVGHVAVASVGGQVDNSPMMNMDFKRKPMGVCREVYTNFMIAYDGRVAPCCVDAHSLELLPDINLNDMTIAEAWIHPSIVKLRGQHRVRQGYSAKCKRCLKAL